MRGRQREKKRDPIEVKAGKVTTDSKSIDHVQYWTALTVFRSSASAPVSNWDLVVS